MIQVRDSFKTVLLLNCFAGIFVSTLDLFQTPYGPRMCSQLCGQVIGFGSCGFDASQITCFVSTSTELPAGVFVLTVNNAKVTNTVIEKSTCINQSRVLYTKRRRLVCVQITASEDKDRPQEKEEVLIPVYRQGRGMYDLLQINPGNGSLAMFSYINLTHLTAVCYIPSVKKLIMSSRKLKKILSANLYGLGVDTLVRQKEANSFAVDEVKHLIFLSTERPACVADMTLDGKNFTTIFTTTGKKILTLTVDPVRERVFISLPYNRKIISTSYKGHNRQIFKTDRDNSRMTASFDADANVLYYTSNRNVFAKYFRAKTYTLIASMKKNVLPQVLHYYGGKLYVAFIKNDTYGIIEGKGCVYRDIERPGAGVTINSLNIIP